MNNRSPIDGDRPSPGLAWLLATGLCGLIALHFFEPKLSVSWGYAHLGREAWLPWLALVSAVAIALGVRSGWGHPWGAEPLGRVRPQTIVFVLLGLLAVSLAFASLGEAPILVGDVKFLRDRMVDDVVVGRWLLLASGYRLVTQSLESVASIEVVIRFLNALVGSIALLALVGCAREIASNRREAAALTMLSFTAFGVAQLVTGYADIYPVPLAFSAVFSCLGLQTIRGARHPAWAMSIAALGPFVYFGLVLLAPAALIVIWVDLQRSGGLRRVLLGGGIGIAIAGAATLPGFGAPFAVGPFLSAIFDAGVTSMGVTDSGYHLPLSRIFTWAHFADIANIMLLVDPVGWMLLVLLFPSSLSVADAASRRQLAFLGTMVAGYAAFLGAMDSLYGAYRDWDLFSYGAVWTSVLGGWAFVSWGRRSSHFGLMVGLAFAAATVHLLARLHAMDVESDLHTQESAPTMFEQIHNNSGRN